MRKLSLMVLTAGLLAGCAATGRPARVNGTGGSHSTISVNGAGSVASAPGPDGNEARHVLPVVISLDIYHLTVPAGAVSRNRDFWQRADEDRVDVATHDLLLKNGVRIGLGRDADWRYFKGVLGKYPSARSNQVRTQPGREGYFELPTHGDVEEESIFGIDDHNNVWGRRFEKCDNLLGISFVASSHDPGVVTVKVCPIVRGLRRYFRTTILNYDETRFELAQPEHLYDMRIEAQIPVNDFLIVAPSPQASLSTSLGATFLTGEGKTEPVEDVLLIVPHAYRTDDPAAPAAR